MPAAPRLSWTALARPTSKRVCPPLSFTPMPSSRKRTRRSRSLPLRLNPVYHHRARTMAGPTSEFWQQRFENQETGWDRGSPGPQLLAWLDSAELQPCRIAVPGCGSGWEVAELAARGFDVTAIDYTAAAVARTQALLAAKGDRE